MPTDWFKALTGFPEDTYENIRRQMEVAGQFLRSKVNGREYAIGHLETPSLGELRQRTDAIAPRPTGPLRVSNIGGDAGALHADPRNAGALFQVASQFNLLEMIGPAVTPGDGVTRYAFDKTQGPACAIAAGAATIYRNYFAEVNGQSGQTRDRQIDCLADLGNRLGNDHGQLWTLRNGYALCTRSGLDAINRQLTAMTPAEIDDLRESLRIGLHWQVEVTTTLPPPGHLVSQAFCSALPVSYTPLPPADFLAFASLILEAAYEATLHAALLNTRDNGAPTVFLTLLGGGAFGNERAWILHALRRALDRLRGTALDIRLVSYPRPEPDLLKLAAEFDGA